MKAALTFPLFCSSACLLGPKIGNSCLGPLGHVCRNRAWIPPFQWVWAPSILVGWVGLSLMRIYKALRCSIWGWILGLNARQCKASWASAASIPLPGSCVAAAALGCLASRSARARTGFLLLPTVTGCGCKLGNSRCVSKWEVRSASQKLTLFPLKNKIRMFCISNRLVNSLPLHKLENHLFSGKSFVCLRADDTCMNRETLDRSWTQHCNGS